MNHQQADGLARRHAEALAAFFRRASVALLAALLVGLAMAASDVRDLDLQAVTNVDARTVNGRIVVTVGSGRPGVTVEHRGNVDYEVSVQGDTLRLTGRNRSLLCIACEVSFEVRLAHAAALQLRTTNGTVSVTGEATRVDAATTNGDVVTMGTAAGPLLLGTTNGRIAVTAARAEVRARNTNGSIELTDVTVPAGSESRAQTTNGSITVRGLATGAALEVTGRVTNGGINVSLDGFTVTYPGSRSFRATTGGDGPASLELVTTNGSLTVLR